MWHPIQSFWQRVRAEVRAEIEPLMRATATRAASDAVAELVPLLAQFIDMATEDQKRRTADVIALTLKLDGLVNGLLGITAQIDALGAAGGAHSDRLVLTLETAAAEIAARVEAQGRAAVERVFSSPVTYQGGRLAMMMASPAGEAVRYAVQKSRVDPTQGENTTKRREALEWARRWLVEHRHPVPPESELNFMIEAAVMESKSVRA